MEPRVSVVVSVFNGEKSFGKKGIENCLNSLFRMHYQNHEIILINDGSTDNTDKILEKYKDRVIYAKNETNKGLAASRNRGTGLAKGEYVAFTDIDCVVDKHWLTELIRCLIENRAEGAGGSVKTPQDVNFFARCVGTLHKPSPKLRSKKEAEVPGCNAIFKRSLLEKMKGFDETFKESNADTDFNVRVWSKGTKIYYEPAAIVYHYHRSTLSSFIKWRFINGIGLYRLARKHAFKVKKLYNLFNLGLIPFVFLVGALALLIRPIILPLLLLLLYAVQVSVRYIKDRNEFRLSEVAIGVLLGWLLRLSGSVGFWYAMMKSPRNLRNLKETGAGYT